MGESFYCVVLKTRWCLSVGWSPVAADHETLVEWTREKPNEKKRRGADFRRLSARRSALASPEPRLSKDDLLLIKGCGAATATGSARRLAETVRHLDPRRPALLSSRRDRENGHSHLASTIEPPSIDERIEQVQIGYRLRGSGPKPAWGICSRRVADVNGKWALASRRQHQHDKL